jgi:hypothetical protein
MRANVKKLLYKQITPPITHFFSDAIPTLSACFDELLETNMALLLETDAALLLLVEENVEVEVEVEIEGSMLMEEYELLLLVVLPDIVPLASRYQFAGGSPRHSPTVMGL